MRLVVARRAIFRVVCLCARRILVRWTLAVNTINTKQLALGIDNLVPGPRVYRPPQNAAQHQALVAIVIFGGLELIHQHKVCISKLVVDVTSVIICSVKGHNYYIVEI